MINNLSSLKSGFETQEFLKGNITLPKSASGFMGMNPHGYYPTTDSAKRSVIVYGDGRIVEEETGRLVNDFSDSIQTTTPNKFNPSFPSGNEVLLLCIFGIIVVAIVAIALKQKENISVGVNNYGSGTTHTT